MLRFAFYSLLLASFATHAHLEDRVGIATYRGQTNVTHDGDFIDFTLEFRAECYDEGALARNRVIGNLAAFTDWLTSARASYVADIDYSVDLINVWRNSSYGAEEPCSGNYSARQEVRIKLKRIESEQALDSDLINKVFNELQIMLGSLNHTDDDNVQWYSESKITSISKGVFEDTAEQLYRAAKAKAERKVTRDFQAFLGADYQGWWHLHSVELSDLDYGQTYIPLSFGGPIGNLPMPSDEENLSTIKLAPIKVSVDGIFVFHFLTTDHAVP